MKVRSEKSHLVRKKHDNLSKVFLIFFHSCSLFVLSSHCFGYLPLGSAGYSGGHAATVSSVLVANLKTGFRKGEWDRVEVLFAFIPFFFFFFCFHFCSCW